MNVYIILSIVTFFLFQSTPSDTIPKKDTVYVKTLPPIRPGKSPEEVVSEGKAMLDSATSKFDKVHEDKTPIVDLKKRVDASKVVTKKLRRIDKKFDQVDSQQGEKTGIDVDPIEAQKKNLDFPGVDTSAVSLPVKQKTFWQKINIFKRKKDR